jgi:beta-mannanase
VTSLQAIAAQGAIPELTWEQWPAGGGPNQPAYADSVITSGQYDTYIRSVATAAKAWNGPILIRYGHEMNGNWYPWAASVNGNTPAAFVAAWQHVHTIFTTAGVANVKWVWCPNAGGPTPVAQVYPGDAYVDIVGMDGYNFSGTSMPSSVFSSLLAQVQAVAPSKPVVINETGTNEVSGNKGPWLQSLFEYVAAQPHIMGVVYSDFGNWILDSSAQAIAGATAGLKSF